MPDERYVIDVLVFNINIHQVVIINILETRMLWT